VSDRQATMTLGEIAAQAATSGECELTKFTFSCIYFVVHPSALQPCEELKILAEAGANLSTLKG